MSRPDPNDKNSKKGLADLGPIPSTAGVASFNLEAVENLLETKSFEAWHLKHAYSPDKANISGPSNPNTSGAQRGVIYYQARKIGIIPQSIKLDSRLSVQGIFGMGSALFNVTGVYQDLDRYPNSSKNVFFRPHDIIVMNQTITTMTNQLIEYNPTGPQRLHYKVRGVDYLADTKRVYQEGTDFFINSVGQIEWFKTQGTKPDIGTVLTCVYYITPIYIVSDLVHELRILPSNAFGHAAFPREATYAPQLIVAKRSTSTEEFNGVITDLNTLHDWTTLPNLPDYPDSNNTTGGSV